MVKLPLGIYLMSNPNSNSSFNRFLRKMGEAPVVYDTLLSERSRQRIHDALFNLGYLHAEVTTHEEYRKHKVRVRYDVRPGEKYYVDTISVEVRDTSILEEMENHQGNTPLKTREKLAVKVFMRTSAYDTAISNYLGHRAEDSTKNNFTVSLPFNQTLRYGDNPHQPSVMYGNFDSIFTQLQGKELSYTNILDLDAAASLIMNFRRPTVAILKHTNPCGVGQDDEDLVEAWKRAYQTDTQAPFGGVIVMNRPMTEALARIVGAIFTDVIIAPDFEPEARAILTKKKNCRIMRIDMDAWREFCKVPMVRTAPGGLMTVKRDDEVMGLDNLEAKVVTKRVPTAEELEAMRFAWRVCKQVHSNAIVFTNKNGTLGIGAGQMSRVDSAKIAVWKAGQAGLDLKGSVIASDGLFPFADGLQTAIDAGATACIQPGGSIRDDLVIEECNKRGMVMAFTGMRLFHH